MGGKRWSYEEEETLRGLFCVASNKQIANVMGRGHDEVRRKVHRMRLIRTDEEVAAIEAASPRERRGDKNPNWKGGLSKNHYHYKKLQVERYPERVKARKAVGDAVRRGLMVRGKCRECGSDEAHAHHEDYSKPLDVEWLCRKHHREVHGGKH